MRTRLVPWLLLPALLTGCYASRLEQRADVLDYLYPPECAAEAPRDVHLELPLRVGIAFVPAGAPRGEQSARGGFLHHADQALPPALDEAQRAELLERIRASFDAVEGVQQIELVPSVFLHARGGFQQLDQLRALLGIDLIALVSYEQVQYGDVNRNSLAYWTGLGAVFLPGNENQTATFVNTSVFDIPSRALLFQASGASRVEDDSSVLELNRELRDDSTRGFTRAIDAMVAELDGALADFREEVRRGAVRGQGTPALTVTARPGYEGVGAAGALELACALALCLLLGSRPGRGVGAQG